MLADGEDKRLDSSGWQKLETGVKVKLAYLVGMVVKR